MWIHEPKAVFPIGIGDKTVDPDIQRTVLSFFVLYLVILGFGALVMATMSLGWSRLLTPV